MNQKPDTVRISGLSEMEAAKRLQKDGYNEIPSAKKHSVFAIALEILCEPMFVLLVACGLIYLLLGEFKEAMMLMGFVVVVMGITFYQERKSERALEALRDLSSPRALVIREGKQKRIAGRDVVNGDIVVLSEGDRVPADCILLIGSNVSTDESLLTGESVPVRKRSAEKPDNVVKPEHPGGDDLPFLYSGTMMVQGQGIACVCATGVHTELGKIGKALQSVESERTLLQKDTAKLVRNLAIGGLLLCILVIVVYGATRGDWIRAMLVGISLAMATLPEELPVILTIFLALGAWRISKKQVLTRRMPVIETLGAATVLCTDKTGTLTMNQMSLHKLFVGGEYYDFAQPSAALPEKFHSLIEFGILSSQVNPFDPMEQAIVKVGNNYLKKTEHIHYDWTLVQEYPLSQKLLAISHVWKSPEGDQYVIASKGAPEAIADLCHLSRQETDEITQKVIEMADQGLRVLGVAKALFQQTLLPEEQHDFQFEFIGLLGMTDPVRPTVPQAIQECYTAGIRVVMITGDYPSTAKNIARQIGLQAVDKIITGTEMNKLSDDELKEKIVGVNIFARVVPEQKLRIVNALKANGEIVAMTGDGVNDAPALKSANIGIAMGGRGTDVARESSSLVLLDDDFSSIVASVKMGRRIFDNIKKAIAYVFAIHIPIAGMTLLPVLFKWPLVLFPVHILFLELIIDPSCSTIFEAEPEEKDVMKRPPRDSHAPLFSARSIVVSVFQGISVLLIVLAVFGIALYRNQGENEARALAYVTLIIANIGLILTNRSWTRTIFATLRTPNTPLWLVTIGTAVFLGLVLYVPFLQGLFKFSYLHPFDIAICLAAGILSIAWFEGLKRFTRILQ